MKIYIIFSIVCNGLSDCFLRRSKSPYIHINYQERMTLFTMKNYENSHTKRMEGRQSKRTEAYFSNNNNLILSTEITETLSDIRLKLILKSILSIMTCEWSCPTTYATTSNSIKLKAKNRGVMIHFLFVFQHNPSLFSKFQLSQLPCHTVYTSVSHLKK